MNTNRFLLHTSFLAVCERVKLTRESEIDPTMETVSSSRKCVPPTERKATNEDRVGGESSHPPGLRRWDVWRENHGGMVQETPSVWKLRKTEGWGDLHHLTA